MAKADETATWAVELVDDTSGAAESAAAALSKLKEQINADTRALADMQKAMRNLQGGTVVNVAQFRELKKQIDAKKQSIASAQSAYLNLGGTFAGLKTKSKASLDAFAALREQAQGVGGPLGGVVGRLSSLQGLVAGGALTLGVVAVAAAFLALSVAVVKATETLLRYGVAQANARRGELLRLEGLTKMRSWLGLAAGNAGEMQAAIDKVSSSTAIGRDKIADYTSKLYGMGLRGDNLALALEGAAIKASVLGEESATAFMGMAASANLAGASVKRLADDVKARFGAIAAKQLLDLDVQMAKLRENFGALFSRLKIEGLLQAIRTVTSVFDASTTTGLALRKVVETLLQPLIDMAPYATTLVRRFFQGIVIGALVATVAVLTVRNWLRKTFGDKSVFAGWDLQMAALYAGAGAFGALIGLGVTLAAVFGTLAVAVALLTAPIWLPVVAFLALKKAAEAVFEWFGSVDWGGIASAIVDGLVDGIKNYGGKAIDAVTGLGDRMWKAMRAKLGIASPSKVFADLGLAIPQGVQVGVDRGAPNAQRAVEDMITPETAAPAPASAPRAGTAAAPLTITIGDIHVNGKADTAASIAGDIRRALERELEGVLIQLGGRLA